MKDEQRRLISWKENILEASKHIYEGDHIHASFKLGFTLQGIMIAIAEMEKESEEDKPYVRRCHICESIKDTYITLGNSLITCKRCLDEKKEENKDPKVDEFKDFFKSDHKSDELLAGSSLASPPYCSVCDSNKYMCGRSYATGLIRWTCINCRMLDFRKSEIK